MATDPASSRLGRGLSSMVSEVSTIKAGSTPTGGGYSRIPLADIHESKPGRIPDHALRESIKQFGVLQPVLVARTEQGFELLAGSRRLQASRDTGLSDVPAIVIPPDRAGHLDVFLEENLSRQELTEMERIRLRNQWMRETGRDEDQARKRIPEPIKYVDEALTVEKREFSPRIWKIISASMCTFCIVLAAMLMMKSSTPDDKHFGSDEMFIDDTLPEVMAITKQAPVIDTIWMENFRFPGNARIVEDDKLSLIYAKPVFSDNNEITAGAKVFLNQVAAIALSSDQLIQIEITGYGADAEAGQSSYALGLARAQAVAAHLHAEGIAEQMIKSISSSQLPNEVGYEQTAKITLHP